MKRLTFGIATALFLLAAPAVAETVPVGDDGLHKPTWLQDTFLDLNEDLAEAKAEGKRLVIIIEQRGCIYCAKMHEQVFPTPEIDAMIRESFFVDQVNLYGDKEMTDTDGTMMAEKDMAKHWNVVFTPTIVFFPEEVDPSKTAIENAVAVMPGAFGKNTTLAMFTWIRDKAYLTTPEFQRYFAENFTMDAN